MSNTPHKRRWYGPWRLIPAVLVMVFASPVLASSPDSLRTYPGEPILVEGERWRDPWIPMASSVIEGDQLRQPGALRLAEVLRPVVGVRVARYGGLGAYMPISIRGSSNEQVVVTVDGRRLNGAQGGGVDLGAIDPAQVERVEVLRGAASALYGTDALGGIVALTTRPDSDRLRHSLQLETGSLGTLAGNFGLHAAATRDVRLWLRGNALRTDGDYAAYDANRQRDDRVQNADIRTRSLGAGLEVGHGGGSKLTVDGTYADGEQGVPGPIEFPTPAARRSDRARLLSIDWQLFDVGVDRSRMQWSAYTHAQDRHYRDPDQGVDDRHVNSAVGGEWNLDVARTDRDTWSIGAVLRQDRLESTSDGDHRRRTGAVSGRLRLTRGERRPLDLGLAVRLDALSGFDPFVSARAGAAWTDGGGRRWRAGAARAFRAPSFTDLFSDDVGAARGNAALRPERAFELDAGLALPRGTLGPLHDARLEVDVFWNSIEDLIQWVPGVDGIWRPHNVGLAILRGIELEGGAALRWQRSTHPLVVTFNTSLLDARNRTGDPNVHGRRLTYRPAVRGTLGLEQGINGRLTLGMTWHLTGASYITAANTKRMPGYGWLDLRADLRLSRQWSAIGAVRNLTDQLATDVRGYPLPRREWRLGVRWGTARAVGVEGQESGT